MTTSPLRSLGATGPAVHSLCLGGNVFGWTADRDASFAVLDEYRDRSGNFIDTADMYSSWVPGNAGGESERLVGEWLVSRGARDEVVLATKVGKGYPGFEKGLAPDKIISGCEQSLRRLRVEHIDLFYAHEDDPATPFDATLEAFDELVRSGKVRYIAASNFTGSRLREALEVSASQSLAGFVALQPHLSLVERADYGEDVQAVVAAYGLGVATYAALAGGFLSGKYRRRDAPPPSGRAGRIVARYGNNEAAQAVLPAAERVAERHATTMAAVAVAWVLAQPHVTCAIASATRPDQLDDLFAGACLKLTDADLAELA